MTNSLTIRPAVLSLAEIKERTALVLKSGLLPASVKTVEQAAVIALKGQELGIGMMQAFEEIYIVAGKPALGTKLLSALYLNAGHIYDIVERNTERVVIDFRRAGGKTYRHTLTMAEVHTARWNANWDREKKAWAEKPTWKSMPIIMLTYRALSTGIRVVAPECLYRMMTQDEAQGFTDAGEEGGIIESTAIVVDDVPADWTNATVRDEFVRFKDSLKLDNHDALLALGKDHDGDVNRVGDYPKSLGAAKRALRAFANERDGQPPEQSELF